MYWCLLFLSWLTCSQGELDDGAVVKLVSPRGTVPRIFQGLPWEPQCLEPSEGGNMQIFLCGYGCLSALLPLPSKPLLWLRQGLSSLLSAPSSFKVEVHFKWGNCMVYELYLIKAVENCAWGS